jgi:hypothetical protein
MKSALVLALFPLPLLAATPAAPTIDSAFKGMIAQVEDDVGNGPDRRLKAIRTTGCKSTLQAKGKSWTIDWSGAEAVALEENFIFLKVPPAQLAIVGDARKPAQRKKLRVLYRAMAAKAGECVKGPDPTPPALP